MATEKISIENDWQAKDDAYTLARAEEILADKKRLSRARKATKVILQEKKKELENVNKVMKKIVPNSKKSNKKIKRKKKK